MADNHTNKRLEKRKLVDLQPFPLQSLYFDDLPEHEFVAFAESVRRELKHPIEVLPKNKAGLPVNTIINGHQRLRALLHNGETETEVWVRDDLADADMETIEKVFLEDNQHRRHMDKLAQARVALRLFEIKKKTKGKKSKRGT